MTPREAKQKYGKKKLKKMEATGLLTGITITMNKNGEPDVPERDYELAYKAARGKQVRSYLWD